MKKKLLLSLAVGATLPIMANYNGDGYYRVENYMTERWVSIVDNRGSINYVSTDADLKAIKLSKPFSTVCSDPGSILYFKKVGDQYNIEAQGTSVHTIIDHYLRLRENGEANGEKLYMCYGSLNGVTRFLGDGNIYNVENGSMSTSTTGNYQKWYIKPITAEGDNYFGVQPTITAGGVNYATMYTSFPYSAYSTGVEFYYINRVDHGMAEMIKATGTIPQNSAVIVKCAGATPYDNRINVGGTPTTISGNSLKGVFFNCDISGHINRVAYDPATMRVLGTCSDGSLGFVTAHGLDFIPKNTAYLVVPAGSGAEFKCVSTEEFDNYQPPITELYLTGNFNGWKTPNEDDSNCIILSKTSEGVFSGTINYSQTGQLSFKLFDAKSANWNEHSYGAKVDSNVTLEAGVASNWEILQSSSAKNFNIANWGGGSGTVTVNLNNSTLSIVTSTIYIPDPTELYVTGNFNNWMTPDIEGSNCQILTKTGDKIYTGTITFSGTQALTFKILTAKSNDWNLYSLGAKNSLNVELEADQPYTWEMTEGSTSNNFVVSNWGGGSGTVTVNLANNTLSLVTSEIFIPEPEYPATIHLTGSMNNWDVTNMDYTLYPVENVDPENPIYTGKFNVPVLEYSELAFKVLVKDNWSENYGAPGNSAFFFTMYSSEIFNGEMMADGGNWTIANWMGGTLEITVDLYGQKISISTPDQPETEPTPELLYLIGMPTDWDLTATDYVLPFNEETGCYEATLNIPENQFEFRFYTQLRSWHYGSIGADLPDNTNVDIEFTDDIYEGPFVWGMGNWYIEDWQGGLVDISVNLEEEKVTFILNESGVEIVNGINLGLWYNGESVISDYMTEITVIDAAGRIIRKEFTNVLDLSDLPKGIYLISAPKTPALKIAR